MTAAFVLIPSQLIEYAHIPVHQHGWVYLPLLLLGFILAIPAIIVAEAKRRMRRIFISGVALIAASLIILTIFDQTKMGLLIGVGLFFIAFNTLEALLPSWLAKRAPVAAKATAMGVNASSQFLGAFFGGVLGGQLLTHLNSQLSWAILAGVACVWLVVAAKLMSPPYLSSLAVRLPDHSAQPHGVNDWVVHLLDIDGVEDVVVLLEQQVAYLKIDKTKMNVSTRAQLSNLLGQNVLI
jgi:predicted MFS family arabinose efflux permease